MANNSSVPHWKSGDTVTCRASIAVTGGRLVGISGARVGGLPRIAHTAADGRAFGVTAYDAAIGTNVTVYREGILDVDAGAAITAGQQLKANASGQVIPWVTSGTVIGYAVDDATSGARVPVDFRGL